jgi:8-oxo-dGTP diphosphatase
MPTYRYPRPAVTVDCVVFGMRSCGGRGIGDDGVPCLQVLLVRRGGAPYKGHLALPGGFVGQGESLDAAAARELKEEAGVRGVYLEQLYTFGEPGRDPRGRVISVAYYALVNPSQHVVTAGSDAAEAAWTPIEAATGLAFDHGQILTMALARLRAKVRYAPVGFELLPETFTLADLQTLYEVILGAKIDRSNFRRKILTPRLLVQAGMEQGLPHRPAALYRFDREKYAALAKGGFVFDL